MHPRAAPSSIAWEPPWPWSGADWEGAVRLGVLWGERVSIGRGEGKDLRRKEG